MSRLKAPGRRPVGPPRKSSAIPANGFGARVKPPSTMVPGTPQGGTGGPAGSWGRLPRGGR